MDQTQAGKQTTPYYPGAQPTVRITPVRTKASRQGVAEILDLQGAWVGSIGDLNTARYVARCINSYEMLVKQLHDVVEHIERTQLDGTSFEENASLLEDVRDVLNTIGEKGE